jgi:surface carbohydrate biosynthesis protein
MSPLTGAGPRVAFIVDHPARDLGGLVLVAAELCRHGITCHLVPLNLMHGQIWSLAPDLVVLNYARPGNARIARALLDAGIRVGVLDTEGAAWETPDAYSELAWSDRDQLHRLAFVCMWGPLLARHMVDRGLLLASQVSVTGCPRFDFYHSRWHGVFDESATPQRPVLLINTNFSFSNPRFATARRNREHLEKELGLGAERVSAYLQAEQAAMRGMIELAKSLAGDFPECEVVLRPHPFEEPTPYALEMAGCAGVTVDGSGPIQSRLSSSLAVIQRSCSTAAEAAMAGVPTLSPQWLPAPALIPFAEAVSVRCGSYQDMRAELCRIMGGAGATRSATLAARENLSDWFAASDGRAYRRVADTVRAALPRERTVSEARCIANLYQLSNPEQSRRQRLAARLRYALRLSPAWAFRQWRIADGAAWCGSEKYFGVDDVTRLAGRIARADAGRELDPARLRIGAAQTDNPRGGPVRSHSVTVQGAG